MPNFDTSVPNWERFETAMFEADHGRLCFTPREDGIAVPSLEHEGGLTHFTFEDLESLEPDHLTILAVIEVPQPAPDRERIARVQVGERVYVAQVFTWEAGGDYLHAGGLTCLYASEVTYAAARRRGW